MDDLGHNDLLAYTEEVQSMTIGDDHVAWLTNRGAPHMSSPIRG